MVSIEIDFSSDQCVYTPGSCVCGKIRVNVPDGIKARKLRIVLVGKAYTYWEGDVRNNTKIKNTDIVRVRHNTADHSGKLIYVKTDFVAWKSDNSRHEMKAGAYGFPFSFQLPAKCPPSFEGDLGFIRYFVKVILDRPWKFDDKFVRCFTVLPNIDLSMVPNAKTATRRQIRDNIGAFLLKKGIVKMEVKIEKQGFVPGEDIPIVIDVDNMTTKKFTKINLRLIQRVTYTGFRDGFQDQKGGKRKVTTTQLNSQIRVDEKKFAEESMEVVIAANSQMQLAKKLTLSSLSPSIKSCKLIDVEYFLKVKLSSSGKFRSTVKLEVPFVVGTRPTDDIKQFKYDYKRSIFGYNGTQLKCKNLQKFAPLYPFYDCTNV